MTASYNFWRSRDARKASVDRDGVASGNQFERVAVRGAHDGEVAMVEGGNARFAEPLRERRHARVGATERQTGVLIDQVGDS